MATIVKNIITDNCNCKNPDVKIEGDCQPPVVDVGSEDAFNDYNYLINKPSINGNVLAGDKTGEDLGLVDAEEGKGLSTNDFTDDYKNKLDHIEPEAQRNVQTDWDQQDATKDDFLRNKPTKVSTWENDADYDTQTGVLAKIAVHNVSDDAHLDIRQSVINERNRATYAENEIAALINGESAERQAADARLQGNINVERDTRILGDTLLQDNIDAEAELRREADNRLQTNINNERSERQVADNQLRANLTAEINNRQTADSALQDQINTFNSKLALEASERAQADTLLQQNINAERDLRIAADTTLEGLISDEATARSNADIALESEIAEVASDLATETSTRIDEDAILNAKIGAEETRAKGVEGTLSSLTTDAKTNLVSAINEVDSHTDTNTSSIGTLNSLTTDAKTNLVAAINEVDSHADTNASSIGTLNSLTTDAKTNLVSAINEVDAHTDTITNNVGALNSLTTDAKTTIVAAINEVDSHADTNASSIGTLSSLTTDTKTNLVSAINEVDSHTDTNTSDIADIQALIPTEADPDNNQLADKDFVNSSIASQTGNFIGTFPNIPARDAYTGTVTNNDYCYVINSVITDNGNDWASFAALNAYDKALVTNFDYAWVIDGSKFDLYRFDVVNQTWDKKAEDVTKEEITLNNAYNRYKAIVTTSPASLTWEYEYTLNNSSFTASQWAAINSGATTTNIGQITTNKNAIGTLNSLTTDAKTNLVSAINELDSTKQDNITDLETIRSGASAGATAAQPGDIGDATITIQKNSTAVDSFTTNAKTNKTINITVPTTASDVNALPDSTKYGAGLTLGFDSNTNSITAQLKDQDGNNLGTQQTQAIPSATQVILRRL